MRILLVMLVLVAATGCAHVCHGRVSADFLPRDSPADSLFCSQVP